ncbi:MAG: YpdA family putative bacillithiol disulfide reductase [bacterium]
MKDVVQNSCDIAVIGAGPAGIAAADTFQEAGYDCLLFDAGCLAQNIARFPIYMEFFSTADLLELRGYPLICASAKPSRREYLQYLARFCRERRLKLRPFEPVDSITRTENGFLVHSTTKGDDRRYETDARFVVIATGAYDTPNFLNCPGEDLPKVSHYFTEVHPYVGSRMLVIGGGNSACEAALLLLRAGVDVTLVLRNNKFGFVKYWVLPDIENRIKEGIITAYFETTVEEIRPGSVVLRSRKEKRVFEIENDFVLALTGYQPNMEFLQRCGVEVDKVSKRPRYNPATFETNVPGLFVCGVIAAGNISAEIFIENSRTHGEQILKALKGR